MPETKQQHMAGRLLTRLKTNWRDVFFIATLLLFVFETCWLALHAAFPMAFDEGFHVGLVQFFANHLNPIVGNQDPSTYQYGNIVQNPSWLYHWLLSFPDRLLALSHSQYIEVVGLRFINIGLAVGSLLLLHRLLGQLRLGYAMRTFIMLLVAFTPSFTALSSQVNYDNLGILMALATSYYTLYFVREMRIGRPHAKTFAKLVSFALLGTMVKFSFLPILAGAVVVVVVYWYLYARAGKHTGAILATSFAKLSGLAKTVIISMLVLSGGLFLNYYGQGLVRYHNLTPSCDQVLDVGACSNYYAWQRNYTLLQNFDPNVPLQGPLVYTYHWAVTSWYHLYGQIIPTGGIAHIAITFYAFLIVATLFAAVATLVNARRLIKRYPMLMPLLGVSFVYLLGLWMRNYHDYRHLGEAVAVQGRYLLPIIGFYYLTLVLGVHEALRKSKELDKKAGLRVERALAVIVVFCFVWFGGTVRYLSEVLPTHRWLTPSEQKVNEVAAVSTDQS